MSTGIKLSKAQVSKIIQSGGFLGSLFSKAAGPLMKVADYLTKNILAPLGITNFEIRRYYQNEPRFNGVYSRDCLPNKIKGWNIYK